MFFVIWWLRNFEFLCPFLSSLWRDLLLFVSWPNIFIFKVYQAAVTHVNFLFSKFSPFFKRFRDPFRRLVPQCPRSKRLWVYVVCLCNLGHLTAPLTASWSLLHLLVLASRWTSRDPFVHGLWSTALLSTMSDHNPGGAPIARIQVDPLPAELQEWSYLPLELIRKPWDHFAPFLASHGYILANTPEYDQDTDSITAPRKPAMDPFHPADDEDFLYRLFQSEGAPLRLENYFQEVSPYSILI